MYIAKSGNFSGGFFWDVQYLGIFIGVS